MPNRRVAGRTDSIFLPRGGGAGCPVPIHLIKGCPQHKMATAAAAVASRLACSHIEDGLSRGDEWLCSPPPPPGLATPDESDRPPEASTAWSDEAEAVLRTEVAGQRFKFADVQTVVFRKYL